MILQDRRGVLCSLGLNIAILCALSATQALAADDDSGIPGKDLIMGDTTPFAPTQMPERRAMPIREAAPSGDAVMGDITPFAPTQLPPSVKIPENSSSPPPFSSDSGMSAPAGAFLPNRPNMNTGVNPNRIPINRQQPSTAVPTSAFVPTPTQGFGSAFLPPPQRQTGQVADQLPISEARRYLLSLINRDRASQGLQGVCLDETATRGGQGHTDEMVINCFHGHWSLAGKKPDQRYTESGGTDYVAENAWFTCTQESSHPPLAVDEQPVFDKRQIEQIEASFMNEVPPNDGHRRNILNPEHTHVGLALSKASVGEEWPRVACTEEFINKYGEYAPIPAAAESGKRITVAGRLYPGVQIYSIDLMNEPLPKPMTVEELNRTGGYNNPSERCATYWPQEQQGHMVLVRNTGSGQEFTADVQIKSRGLNYIWVWAKTPDRAKPFIVSARTLIVR